MSRPETGPMEFEDDWKGIFIRGDDAGPLAFVLRTLADNLTTCDIVTIQALKHIIELLELAEQSNNTATVSRMKEYQLCTRNL